MFYNVGSPRYMSPEAYQDNIYSEKSDIWGIGVTFYEMVTGTTFDKGKNIVQTFKLLKEKGIPIPPTLSQKTKKLIQGMLMLSPSKRLSCEQVLQEMYVHMAQQIWKLNKNGHELKTPAFRLQVFIKVI